MIRLIYEIRFLISVKIFGLKFLRYIADIKGVNNIKGRVK
jgi:hypothetical protein